MQRVVCHGVVPYNELFCLMGDSAIVHLPTLGQRFWLDTPRTKSSYRGLREGVTKFTREYGGILISHFPVGQTLETIGYPY